MRILVPVKRVVDYRVPIHVRDDGSGVETSGVKMSMNPFDEIALEEALRCYERGEIQEVVVVTIGDHDDVLRHALALGAQRAYWLATDNPENLEPLMIAKYLYEIVKKLDVDCVFMGKQAIDNDCNQTAQMLAGLWDCPQATFASQVKITSQGFEVTREVDTGLEVVSMPYPCVISADLRLNTPRYPALPAIIQAKTKPLTRWDIHDFSVDTKPKLLVERIDRPAKRPQGTIFTDVDDFFSCLISKGLGD